MERVKRIGEAALAITAIAAVLSGLVAMFGGSLPPWATVAWAASVEQSLQNDDLQIQQLSTLLLSDKVANIQSALAKNPGDPNLQASYNYWNMQLQRAMSATLPQTRRPNK